MIIPFWVKGVGALIIAGVLCGLFYLFVDYQQQVGYDRRTGEYLVQENKDLKAAQAETVRLNALVKEAQHAAKEREKINRDLSARNSVLLGKLRNTDADIDRLVSNATADALAYATRAFSGLFAECRGAYDEMGRAAAGHYSDVKKVEQGWPQ